MQSKEVPPFRNVPSLTTTLTALKSQHFNIISQTILESLEGLIFQPSGYQSDIKEEFDELGTYRRNLTPKLESLKQLQLILTSPIGIATFPGRDRLDKILKWGKEIRTFISYVEEYLDELYTGIDEIHHWQKDFTTSQDPSSSAQEDDRRDLLDSGTNTDPSILNEVKKRRAIARSLSSAELATLKLLADWTARKLFISESKQLFNPLEVAAESIYTIFYQDLTIEEKDYLTRGSPSALRSLLLMSQGVMSAIVDLADHHRLVDKKKIFFSHAQTSEEVQRALSHSHTEASCRIQNGYVTLLLNDIPPKTMTDPDGSHLVKTLKELSKLFTQHSLVYSELNISPEKRAIEFKIAIPKIHESSNSRPESVERLSALEPPEFFFEARIEIPWSRGQQTIKCRTDAQLICNPLVRETWDYILSGLTPLFEYSELPPSTAELFFDKRKGAGSEHSLIQSQAYGVRLIAGDET